MGEPSTEATSAKPVFLVHAVDAAGTVVIHRLGKPAEPLDQRLHDRLHVAARNGLEEEQFVVGQRAAAGLAKTRAEPLAVPGANLGAGAYRIPATDFSCYRSCASGPEVRRMSRAP